MRCGGARSRRRRKRTPNEASHWPHTRRLRPALEFRSSEVGAVSRRPDVVLRLQLPPAALPEPLAYVVIAFRVSEAARSQAPDRGSISVSHRQRLGGPRLRLRPVRIVKPLVGLLPVCLRTAIPFKTAGPATEKAAPRVPLLLTPSQLRQIAAARLHEKLLCRLQSWHMVRQRGG